MREQTHVKKKYSIGLLKTLCILMSMFVFAIDFWEISNTSTSILYYSIWFLKIAAACSVNCYVIAIGYEEYEMKWDLIKIFNLWFITGLYAKTIIMIFGIFLPSQVNKADWIQALFPIATNQYWFICSYIGILLLSPILNNAVKTTSANTIKVSLSIVFVLLFAANMLGNDSFGVSQGQGLMWFILMYIVGAYIKKYNSWKIIRPGLTFLSYLSLVIFTLFFSLILHLQFSQHGISFDSTFLLNSTSPSIVLASIFLFISFKNIRVHKWLKPLVKISNRFNIGPYLVFFNPLIVKYCFSFAFNIVRNSHTLIKLIFVIGGELTVFISCLIIEGIRVYIYNKINLLQFASRVINWAEMKSNKKQKAPVTSKKVVFELDAVEKEISNTVESICDKEKISIAFDYMAQSPKDKTSEKSTRQLTFLHQLKVKGA